MLLLSMTTLVEQSQFEEPKQMNTLNDLLSSENVMKLEKNLQKSFHWGNGFITVLPNEK